MNQTYDHIPVLLSEVIFYLQPQPGQNFIDATLGGGGYTREILKEIGTKGKILAIDLDQSAIDNAKAHNLPSKNVTLTQGNFARLESIVKNHDFPAPNGIVADLGLSSFELDHSGRGISFSKKEPLDMRFDLSSQTGDARFLLRNKTFKELSELFHKYGEDKFSTQIAKKIVSFRDSGQEIHYTTDLYNLIKEALPKPVKHKADDSARRIFQALRIAVNHELESLTEFLPKAFNILKPGGRLVVVSFHSLEDRIVKHFFISLTKGCICPPEFPHCICGKSPEGKIITKKIVTAGSEESALNPRSNSAKLRVVEKL